jgi:hypothetical protein
VATKKKYEELPDLEKLQKQWHKLSGLHTREEWSAAIVRAATAAEIAANFTVRKEFENKSELDSAFVNNLLRWANGLAGKMNRLLIPICEQEKAKLKTMKTLRLLAEAINSKRNAIAHQGEFCNEGEAKDAIRKSREFITTLIQIYEAEFVLKERKR